MPIINKDDVPLPQPEDGRSSRRFVTSHAGAANLTVGELVMQHGSALRAAHHTPPMKPSFCWKARWRWLWATSATSGRRATPCWRPRAHPTGWSTRPAAPRGCLLFSHGQPSNAIRGPIGPARGVLGSRAGSRVDRLGTCSHVETSETLGMRLGRRPSGLRVLRRSRPSNGRGRARYSAARGGWLP